MRLISQCGELFARATLAVKLVMIILIISSFWSWAIIIQKLIFYRKAKKESARFDRAFWSGEPLDGLFKQIGPEPDGAAQTVFANGMVEWPKITSSRWWINSRSYGSYRSQYGMWL